MAQGAHLTDWFRDARWGVLTHYLESPASHALPGTTSADDWNRRVDSFDAGALADQLAEVGAKYYFITLGQNSGHYCSPNAAYDQIVGRVPSLCSKRDLPADLYAALSKKGIRLMLYIPAHPPEHANDMAPFKGKAGDLRVTEPRRLWESVIREWSVRYGKRIAGWWVDGCWPKASFESTEAPNFESLRAALKAGNPDALLGFNPGGCHVPVPVNGPEDYTAGELTHNLPLGDWCAPTAQGWPYQPLQRFINGAQYHVLNFLGEWWGQGQPRFPDELVTGYTRYVNDHQGVVTWDVPISNEGRLPEAFVRQLKRLG